MTLERLLILPAAGSSQRMGFDKLWQDVDGRPVLAWTLQAVARAETFDVVCIAAQKERWEDIERLARDEGIEHLLLCEGGHRRQDTVRSALEEATSAEFVSIHDAARPLCSPRLFRAVLAKAQQTMAATAALPCTDTVKRVNGDVISETLPREELMTVQTPQAFSTALLRDAHREALSQGWRVDDDAELVERMGWPVHVVTGERRNIKLTYASDFEFFRALRLEEAE